MNFTNENIPYPYDNTKLVISSGITVHNGKIWIVGGGYYDSSGSSTNTYLNKAYSYDGTTFKKEADFPISARVSVLHSFKGGLSVLVLLILRILLINCIIHLMAHSGMRF